MVDRAGTNRPHSSLPPRYGPAFPAALSQLLMATPPAAEDPLLPIPASCLRSLDLAPWPPGGSSGRRSSGGGGNAAPALRLAAGGGRSARALGNSRTAALEPAGRCPLPLAAAAPRAQQRRTHRHVAMLLPHGFSRSEGIRFAPESLELWITHRLFLLDDGPWPPVFPAARDSPRWRRCWASRWIRASGIRSPGTGRPLAQQGQDQGPPAAVEGEQEGEPAQHPGQPALRHPVELPRRPAGRQGPPFPRAAGPSPAEPGHRPGRPPRPRWRTPAPPGCSAGSPAGSAGAAPSPSGAP